MTASQLPLIPELSADFSRILFGPRAEQTHEPWRRLFSDPRFSFREGLSPQERTALSYERLRLINEAIADPVAFASDIESLTAMHEWAGVVDAGAATIASIHWNLHLGSLLDHDHDGRDLSPYARMERIGTFLCTELDHGNDAAAIETTATWDAGGFTLNTPTPGACKWMPNTSSIGGAKTAVVAARLVVDDVDRGVFLFLTPLTDNDGSHYPGIEVRPLPQTASAPVDHCATSFRDVRLPFEALLQGDHGRLSRDGTFTSTLGNPRKRFLRSIGRVHSGKLCMAAYSLGVTRHALAVTMRYSHRRLTSGMTTGRRVPLIAHRSHHAPLLSAVATTYAATLLHRSVVRQWVSGADAEQADIERLAAISKAWITWKARAVMTECRERCGAQGLLLSNGIAYQLAANEGTVTAEGDNRVIWVKAAGEMLMGGFTPKPASEVPVVGRSLNEPAFLQDLLADIERIWHGRARSRLRGGRRGNPLARWNGTVTPALTLVEAHVHRLAAEALLNAADQVLTPQAREVLGLLHRLFALEQVKAHSGDLLAEGRLTTDQVRCLPDAEEAIIEALLPHALELSDGFAALESRMAEYPMLQGAGDRQMVPV
ncbi:acyl-CoA oxidase [Streptomyces sp. Go40/10]|uniref:acyl-CoA dehydrogenase family protein n=1 Tax=Streptomyces sp. Go40/10 TaxID=2825844 RepID=UPI001E50198C|nr:acyl-CoA dehydrogenase [Streptomyces sp. Go40/10]UFQ99771.1 acyl-CoA oxidase [Streptomyces sp. Go40/10]UFR07176.1 acyl-CoA oxidase [Streptomyces sp. Go40/10]